jgi:hypothetical protein
MRNPTIAYLAEYLSSCLELTEQGCSLKLALLVEPTGHSRLSVATADSTDFSAEFSAPSLPALVAAIATDPEGNA